MASWENRDVLQMAASEERRQAAKEITTLAEADSSFSFLRLGDGELGVLLDRQNGAFRTLPDTSVRSMERAFCHPGLQPAHADRLLHAYENCSYLDYHDHLAYNRANIPLLELKRTQPLRNEGPSTAGILAEWAFFELPGYTSKHRSLFCGAEASLLEALMGDPVYRKCSSGHWPVPENCFFVQPIGNGVDLSANLDAIKRQLAEAITVHRIHTIFLGLGGAAKILCVELARECGVRAFDFGSMMRALTYSGSAGNAECRASHGYFFFHVPFETYMNALEKTGAGSPARTLNKAHAQLAWELQEKHPVASTPSDLSAPETFSIDAGNLRRFRDGMKVYRKRYLPLREQDPECGTLVREFDRWQTVHGLGFKGKFYRLRRLASRILRCGR